MATEGFPDLPGNEFSGFRSIGEPDGHPRGGGVTLGRANNGRARVPGQHGGADFGDPDDELPADSRVPAMAATTLPEIDLARLGASAPAPDGGAGPPDVAGHPLLRGLLRELPPKGTPLPPGWLDRWFAAARSILDLLYAQDPHRAS
ncbi:MAG TPA: hypothetical protein VFY17_04275 [Pilimelia sp.]|nr:hypothetical protein [Pilimelia sp.]